LHTMHGLWLEAASNGGQPGMPAVANMPETVAKFFEHEDPVPPHRWESEEDREQRERLSALGCWPGG